MGRLQPESRDGANPNPNDHEPQSTGNDCNKVFTGNCEPIERNLWNPNGLVVCRSCNESNWLQSCFGYSETGIHISALLCRNCYDLCVVRHVKHYMPHFIMAAYYVATRNVAGDAQYEKWSAGHTFRTMASVHTFERKQPNLPRGFRKGKLC